LTLRMVASDALPEVGDFNLDGIMDVVWGAGPLAPGTPASAVYLQFASVCPAAGTTVFGQDNLCMNPLQIVPASEPIAIAPTDYVSMTAGNFTGAVDSTTGRAFTQLLLTNVGAADAHILAFSDFDENLVPGLFMKNTGAEFFNLLADTFTGNLQAFLASGRLDWSGQQDQAVFASTQQASCCDRQGVVSVLTFDENLNATMHTQAVPQKDSNGKDQSTRIFGLAVGRFDPPEDSKGDTDFNQGFAVLVDRETKGATFAEATWVYLYNVDPMILAPGENPVQQLKITDTRYYNGTVYWQVDALQSGDLQGRSLLLGPPEKTTVTHTQPDTILGLPPMHVDYIEPLGGGDPQVLNVTVFPNTFNTAYNFEVTTGMQASSKSSTSYTTATKESAQTKVTYGIPDVDSVSVKIKESATQTHQSTVSNTYNTYSGKTYSFNTTTQFDDKVAATSLQMNIYSYPVIGQMICPQDSPNCPDDCSPGTEPCPLLPLQVQYSGPDNVFHIAPSNAAGLEWFQPPNEPGNAFSYAGSLTLLEAAAPQQLDLLTPMNEAWDSQSSESFSINWTQGGGDNVSSGSVSTFSFDTSVSVSGKASFEGASASGSASVDFNQSNSASTLNTSSHTFGASTGVTLNHGIQPDGSASSLQLLYEGQSYIFGQYAPSGTIQTDLQLNTDLQSEGFLQVAHVADMLSTDPVASGAWWKQAYTVAPDVALHHPQRWLQKLPTSQNTQQVLFNCPIGFTSSFGTPTSNPGSCTPTNDQPTPLNVTDAPFYQMKGLFVTPGTSAGGPTTTLATLGDTLTLQARVYNYSLASMPPDTEVHVRFYAQPWDATTGQFAGGSGQFGFAEAVFIGEDVIMDPIPAFCGGSQGAFDSCTDETAPLNWVLAQVQWDTSALSPLSTTETTWKFWVVVWMEDSAGNLLSEIAEHGLTSIPGENLNSLAEVPIETYSNNLGFYNQVFTLELPTESPSAVEGILERSLSIDAVEVSSPTVLRDQATAVRVHHRAGGSRFDHVLALIYEGDPYAGGELLDMDIIPRVPKGSRFVVPFLYHPQTCGPQTLFLQAVPRDGGQIAEAMLDVFVTLDPLAQTRLLIEQVESLGLKPGPERSLLAKLEAAARSFQRGNRTAGLNQLGAFANQLDAQSGKKVQSKDAAQMIARVADLKSCL
jgi:hypothetical protein